MSYEMEVWAVQFSSDDGKSVWELEDTDTDSIIKAIKNPESVNLDRCKLVGLNYTKNYTVKFLNGVREVIKHKRKGRR